MAIALKQNQQIKGEEAVAERPDGVRVPFLAYPTPLHDLSGRITGAVNMLVDITERKRAEAIAERLASIVEFSDDAIISKDLDGVITSWNVGAERMFGYAPDEIVGKSIMTLIPSDRSAEEADILARIRRGEPIQHYETVRQRKDGSQVWVSLSISPLRDARGNIFGVSKIARDMTERRRADEHRKVLVDELNHRVKNTLAVIQSIASQTLGQAATVAEARDAFGLRLISLARTHDILTRANWAGANWQRLSPTRSSRMQAIKADSGSRGRTFGSPRAPACYRHGPARIGHQRRKIRRAVHGGAPTKKGFGSVMIERVLSAELIGQVRVAYELSGLVCMIDAPLSVPKPVSENW